ncbi:carboxymuconolactone decarboxylase family protein [Allorhizocola rhizosphaerae]|uniref:carboxymuconolactone decarboxylase family protein n=1 Tax=Allorhizocola rhizosphaerae TaxID=1872709 RepID=UPI0013C2C967|nr:carboxymuconolactone decarboxylase family protein [Allorhizocola rhizosphaerae]
MTAVRLLAAADAPLLAAPYYRGGDPGPIVRSLAHVPELLEAAMPFIGVALGPSGIPWRTKELVIVRVSARAGCRYCVQAHTAVALDAGLTRDEILALRLAHDFRQVFTDPRERAVIAWSDAATSLTPPDPQTRAEAAEHLAEHELVELTVLAGATLMLNRLATMLELPTAPSTLARLNELALA